MGAPGRASTQLLEREAESRGLEQAVSDATDGHPRLLVIEGPAGIGKTSLLRELRDLGDATGMVVRWARGTVLEQRLAWTVVRQLLTQPVLDLSSADRAQVLDRAAALAPAVLGLRDDGAHPLQFSEALHALYWLVVELSARRPLLLIVDDAQWADRESLAFMNYVGNRLEGQAILLAVAIRTGEPPAERSELNELQLVPDRVTVMPGPLSRRASVEIVDRRLGGGTHPDLCERFYDLSAGNPFLLHELCRGFEPSGSALADPAERAATTAAQRVSISVLSRLARYPPLALAVAEAVAILGASANLYTLTRLTGASSGEVANVTGHLIEAEILTQTNHTVDFVHPLIRRAVYEHLHAVRRQLIHAQAAELLREADAPDREIALQLLHAMPAAEPWRVALLRRAAAETLAAGAPEAASTYLRRALHEPPRREEMHDLLLELGNCDLHHDPRAAAERFSQAHALAASTEARITSALSLRRAYALLGDFDSALAVLNQAADELDGADSRLRRQLDSARLVFARWDYGFQDLRDRLFSDLRARADAGGELDSDERANLAHELAARGEDLDVAAESARWAIRNSGTVSATGAASVLQLTSVLVICDLFDEAEEIALRAVMDAESRGSGVDACAALTLATYCALRRGDVGEAVERAQSAVALASGVWNVGAVAWLSEALAEQDQPNDAKALLRHHGLDQPSVALTEESPLGYQDAMLLYHRGRTRALAGDLTKALDDLQVVSELAEGWRIENPAVLAWRSSMSGLLLTLERRDEALELAAEEVRLARRWGAA